MIREKWLINSSLSACKAYDVLGKIIEYLFLGVKEREKLLLFVYFIDINVVDKETYDQQDYYKGVDNYLIAICE